MNPVAQIAVFAVTISSLLGQVTSSADMLAPLGSVVTSSWRSQTPGNRRDSHSNTSELLGWEISDDDFSSLLLQVETVLPVYESSLADIESFLSSQKDLPYRDGKMIQEDVKLDRSDIAEIRKTISSLKSLRSVEDEVDLVDELRSLARDGLDLQRDELDVGLENSQLSLTFPDWPELRSCGKQFTIFALKLGGDFKARIHFLEMHLARNKAGR